MRRVRLQLSRVSAHTGWGRWKREKVRGWRRGLSGATRGADGTARGLSKGAARFRNGLARFEGDELIWEISCTDRSPTQKWRRKFGTDYSTVQLHNQVHRYIFPAEIPRHHHASSKIAPSGDSRQPDQEMIRISALSDAHRRRRYISLASPSTIYVLLSQR